jgi:hypothetical protein
MKSELIKVRVLPNSKHESVGEMDDGRIKVKLSTPPEDGKANAHLIEILAQFFKKDCSKIKIVRGAKSKDKLIKIID